MIDHVSRKRMAQALRHFSIGRISNHEYENRIYDMFYMENVEERLYDAFASDAYWIGDDDTYKLKGKYKLSPKERKNNARIILFLRSSFPYRWTEEKTTSPIGSLSYLSTILVGAISAYGLLFGIFASILPVVYLSVVSMLLTLFIFIQIKREEKLSESGFENLGGDRSVWPFFTREEYEYALANPVYLARSKKT